MSHAEAIRALRLRRGLVEPGVGSDRYLIREVTRDTHRDINNRAPGALGRCRVFYLNPAAVAAKLGKSNA